MSMQTRLRTGRSPHPMLPIGKITLNWLTVTGVSHCLSHCPNPRLWASIRWFRWWWRYRSQDVSSLFQSHLIFYRRIIANLRLTLPAFTSVESAQWSVYRDLRTLLLLFLTAGNIILTRTENQWFWHWRSPANQVNVTFPVGSIGWGF